MQGLVMGLFSLSQGLGASLGVATIYPFYGVWFSGGNVGSINCQEKCHLDYYFFFLSGLQVSEYGLFLGW